MSLELTLHLAFPAAEASAVLRDLAALLIDPPGRRKVPVVTIVAPDGDEVRIPYLAGPFKKGEAARPLGEGFYCEVLIALGRSGIERRIFPVGLFLAVGREFLSVRLENVAPPAHHLMLEGTDFHGRIAELMERNRGAAAAFEGMGAWHWFGGPGESFDGPDPLLDPDAFAQVLIDLQPVGG